ncbi:hypothetical protein E4U50_004372 [Claviceps purpurea]|nr:hypothetical protein E4U50_004372 [Claviceps purpurea]
MALTRARATTHRAKKNQPHPVRLHVPDECPFQRTIVRMNRAIVEDVRYSSGRYAVLGSTLRDPDATLKLHVSTEDGRE